jgi:hypothetical protein
MQIGNFSDHLTSGISVRHPLPTLARGGALAAPTSKPSLAMPLHAPQLLLERRVNPQVVMGSARRLEGTLIPVAPHCFLGRDIRPGVIIVGVAGQECARRPRRLEKTHFRRA